MGNYCLWIKKHNPEKQLNVLIYITFSIWNLGRIKDWNITLTIINDDKNWTQIKIYKIIFLWQYWLQKWNTFICTKKEISWEWMRD